MTEPDIATGDFDGDGVEDDTAYGYDDNNDGVYDQVDVDLNTDGGNDVSGFDQNDDGVYDHVQYDSDGDGEQDSAMSDTNYDGTIDEQGAI
ncbi:hypothetical protein [Stackebrandtia nassauensis]|uniref:Tryptophan synthase, beta chain n=1 Tax=Stackebrandtia nassauensis (strain DSM 44728 / CIP 108903 / NRRL B-16338 / NBRC 102104 / LLR-40K-21) TaxID=446470 RepID=D3PW45_STANL|nr:hypothetical protein [Stackebrandtia nassauensis]ADD41202.1 tryptophan synthase, beta chain [Stackebrandtia nassauensis DSM 44728]